MNHIVLRTLVALERCQRIGCLFRVLFFQQRKANQTSEQAPAINAARKISSCPSVSRFQATTPKKMPNPSAIGNVVWNLAMVFNFLFSPSAQSPR